jgi:hypothetical protein
LRLGVAGRGAGAVPWEGRRHKAVGSETNLVVAAWRGRRREEKARERDGLACELELSWCEAGGSWTRGSVSRAWFV